MINQLSVKDDTPATGTPETEALAKTIEESRPVLQKSADPVELLAKALRDKDIKAVERDAPFNKNFVLYDLSLQGRGTDEDKTYAYSEWHRKHVRRGNTVVEEYNPDGKKRRTLYGRKGFEKFFDLCYEYMMYNMGKLKDFSGRFGIHNADEHMQLHNVIFNGAKKAIEDGNEVTMYKSVKANGENAQISFNYQFNAWLVASKNVAMLARTAEDLERYDGERYYFAYLIGQVWFKKIAKLAEENKLDDLKKDMHGRTFVGEYCGNQEHQHLVKYTEVDLHFVAIVDNQSMITCIPPEEAFDIFDKYGLTHVKYTKYGYYKDWKQLNEALKKIYSSVAESEIDNEEEGSVIYMVKRDKDGNQETLSLSKLKTLEYRIYRKLREKLRSVVRQPNKNSKSRYNPPEPSKIFSKFVRETEDLCKENQPPYPLGYYFYVGKKAFEYVKEYPKDSHLIHEKYITFLSALLHCVDKGEKLQPKLLRDEKRLEELMQVSWTTYKNYKDPNQPELAKVFSQTTIGTANSTEESKSTGAEQTVYIIVPMGIPGMGKSNLVSIFHENLDKYDASFDIISSDDTRAECMDKQGRKNKNLSRDELFDKTGKEARDLFNKRLSSLLANAHKKRETNIFIFLDKNHPPNAIPGVLKLVDSEGSHLNKRFIALTPSVKETYSIEKSNYPFSLEFFLNCYNRVQNRQTHATLPGSGVKSAGIMFFFLDFFRNASLDSQSLSKNGFDLCLSIPFTKETKTSAELPAELRSKLNAVLAVPEKDKGEKEKKVQEFDEEFQAQKFSFAFPERTEIAQTLIEFLDKNLVCPGKDGVPRLAKNTSVASSNGSHKYSKEESKQEQPTKTKATKGQKGRQNTKGEYKVYQVKQDTIATKSDKEFNPKYTPIYIGIFERKDSTSLVRSYLLACFDALSKKYSDDANLSRVEQEIQTSHFSKFAYIADYHLTSYYLGGSKDKRDSPYFKNFVEGLDMDIRVKGVVLACDYLVTGICFPDNAVISVENKYPHVTLLSGSWKPVKSNDMLVAACSNGGFVSDQYAEGKFQQGAPFAEKGTVKVGKTEVTVYAVKLQEDLVIPGVTKAFY